MRLYIIVESSADGDGELHSPTVHVIEDRRQAVDVFKKAALHVMGNERDQSEIIGEEGIEDDDEAEDFIARSLDPMMNEDPPGPVTKPTLWASANNRGSSRCENHEIVEIYVLDLP